MAVPPTHAALVGAEESGAILAPANSRAAVSAEGLIGKICVTKSVTVAERLDGAYRNTDGRGDICIACFSVSHIRYALFLIGSHGFPPVCIEGTVLLP